MTDDSLRRLQSFRDALDSQDAILREAMMTSPKYEASVPAARPIKKIFDEILDRFPGLIQSFDYHANPSALRAQIAGARLKIQDSITVLELEATEEAQRNELCISVRVARQLLNARRGEQRNLIFFQHATPEEMFETVLPWIDRTIQTLRKIFVSPWSIRQFEQRMSLTDMTDCTAEALLSRINGAVEFLSMLDEDLYVIEQTAHDQASTPHLGRKIFIGHGRSLLWHELKDFIETRLRLQSDEFNREPTAGLFTGERLTVMLEDASFALLVMTGEDEQPDGRVRARENVVHEAGLFQGRLGFKRAIILLEDGCEAFSKIGGLTVIRFPRGQVSMSFEEIRRTLEREGILRS